MCHEFIQGATRPSLGSLIVAAVVTAVLFASCFIFITPELMGSEAHRYFAVNKLDAHNCASSARAQRLSCLELSQPAVFILGTSSDRQALTSTGQLAHLIADQSNITPSVQDLTMAGETHWEMAALTDMLPERFDGVVLLGLGTGPPRFLLPVEELEGLLKRPRVGFVSKGFDHEVRLAQLRIPERTGNYFWDNRSFFASRLPYLFWNLVTVPVDRMKYVVLNKIRVPVFDLDLQVQQMKEQLADYDERAEEGLGVFARIGEKVARRGRVAVVIVQSPVNPEFIARAWGSEFYEHHRRYVRKYAQQHGMLYWDLNDAAALTSDDFYDGFHLRSPQAQLRYTTVLAEELAELLQETIGKENK